jgi:mRNA interferase YafQ
MRTISRTNQFKKDYQRERSGKLGTKLEALLREGIRLLAGDIPLPRRYRDHQLAGKLRDCRDCHICPDLVLLYRKPDDGALELVRLGSHSELGL